MVTFPGPGREHLACLARQLLLRRARLLDPRWTAPLTGAELEALGRYWPGGSIRRLARLLEVVVSARDRGILVV